MIRTTFLTALALVLLLLPAPPAAAQEDAWYVVRPGDYLFRIARLTGTSVEALKRNNGLTGDIIHPEQRLRVRRPFAPTRGGAIAWRHPCDTPAGEVLRPFGEQRRGDLATRHTGVDLAYPRGGRVLAPAHGVVRYLGDQDGYGRLMIIEHGGDFATVLGPFADDAVYVEAGRVVLGGDGLGLTGAPVEGNLPYLHVELRRDNQAVDPARLLR